MLTNLISWLKCDSLRFTDTTFRFTLLATHHFGYFELYT